MHPPKNKRLDIYYNQLTKTLAWLLRGISSWAAGYMACCRTFTEAPLPGRMPALWLLCVSCGG